MKLSLKLALFVLSLGAISWVTGACLFRWLGTFIGGALVDRLVV